MSNHQNDKSSPLIAFVHVPKTAGSFVNAQLKSAGLAGQGHIEHWLSNPDMAKERIRHLDWVSGHVPFPVMRDFLRATTNRPVKFFTAMRDPLKQIASHYNWLIEIYHKGASFYDAHPPRIKEISETIRSSDNSDPMQVIENLDKFAGLFLNQQSRLIIGPRIDTIAAFDLSDALRPFTLVANESTLHRMLESMGLPNAAAREKVNASRYHFDPRIFDDRTVRAFLAKRHGVDISLYAIAGTLHS